MMLIRTLPCVTSLIVISIAISTAPEASISCLRDAPAGHFASRLLTSAQMSCKG